MPVPPVNFIDRQLTPIRQNPNWLHSRLRVPNNKTLYWKLTWSVSRYHLRLWSTALRLVYAPSRRLLSPWRRPPLSSLPRAIIKIKSSKNGQTAAKSRHPNISACCPNRRSHSDPHPKRHTPSAHPSSTLPNYIYRPNRFLRRFEALCNPFYAHRFTEIPGFI